jgi:hypothetical protein
MVVRLIAAILLGIVSLLTYDQAHCETQGLIYSVGAGSHKPAAAMNNDGVSVVVWEQDGNDGDGLGTYGLRFDNSGIPIGSTFRANTYTTSHQREPSVAIDNAGNFVVAWSSWEQEGEGDEIYFRRYDASGVPQGPETRANAVLIGDQRFSDMDIDDMGRFVIVWHSSGPFGDPVHPPGVYGRRFDTDGTPLGDEFFVVEIDPQMFPVVAVDGSGNIVVAWDIEHEDGYWWGVFGRLFDTNDNPLGDPFVLNTTYQFDQIYVDVSMAADGRFVAVWTQGKGEGVLNNIMGQRFSATGDPVGEEFVLSIVASDVVTQPSIDVVENGDFAVAWQGFVSDPYFSGIWYKRYYSNGLQVSNEVTISPANDEIGSNRPSIATSTNGAIVAWERFNQVYIGHIPVLPVEVQHTTWGAIKG